MSRSILVVEDNEDLLLLFKLVLESAGYQVVTVDNGKEALHLIETIKPQLVLMDIMMPNVNGLQVTSQIKQKQDYQSLPIILVSAIDHLQDFQFNQSKADDIIYKPFDIDELILRVGNLTRDCQEKIKSN